jgi:hypothetical protein
VIPVDPPPCPVPFDPPDPPDPDPLGLVDPVIEPPAGAPVLPGCEDDDPCGPEPVPVCDVELPPVGVGVVAEGWLAGRRGA